MPVGRADLINLAQHAPARGPDGPPDRAEVVMELSWSWLTRRRAVHGQLLMASLAQPGIEPFESRPLSSSDACA
jgi:hypothetical protein